MNQPLSIKAYLQQNISKLLLFGFVLMVSISGTVTYFLGQHKMATELQETALSASKAFRSRILEGDIRAVQVQLHDVLNLKGEEQILILNKNFEQIYNPTYAKPIAIKRCDAIGTTCFHGFLGTASVFIPIFFDESEKSLFGYLYLTKKVQTDWVYAAVVFLIFFLSYLALLFGLTNITKTSLGRLASNIQDWSLRLKNDPKDDTPLSAAPFAELAPLKEAIEGLNAQIEKYEGQASQKAKLLILRGIAHDLLGPVSQLQRYLAILEEMTTEPGLEDIFKEVKDSLSHITMTASQVKSLKELPITNDTSNLIDAVTAEVNALAKTKDIYDKQIKLTLAPIREKKIMTPLSRAEVSRIVQNLVQNAAEASSVNSEIKVTVSRNCNSAYLAIEDSGQGIPEELQKKVFEPDFTSKPATGTGLGLSIVKHLVQQKDGRVKLKSTPGLGTTVTIEIPITNAVDGGINAAL